MSALVTITTLTPNTYRVSEITREDTYCYQGRLSATPEIEARNGFTGEQEKVREVNFDIFNGDAWIDLSTEDLWGATVQIAITGISETWTGKITSFSIDDKGVVGISAKEDTSAVLSLMLPDNFLRIASYANMEASASMNPIPMVFGGSASDPLRVPGMVVDRVNFRYIFCVGEIRQIVNVYKDNTLITTGFTGYTGTSGQGTYPGYVYLEFAADPRDAAGRWPEVVIEIAGLKLSTLTEAQCRNPARILYYLLITARTGVCGWGLGVASVSVDSTAFDTAIIDCDNVGFLTDGVISDYREARFWVDEICKSCRGRLSYVAGKWTLKIDKDSASAKTYTTANMRLLSFGKGNSDGRTNRVKTEFRYRYGFQNAEYVGYAEKNDTTSQTAIGTNEKTLSLRMVSDHNTASYISDYHLYGAAYTESKIRFETNDFSGVINGSVITITYATLGLSADTFRVIRFTSGTLNADGDLEMPAVIEAESYSSNIFSLSGVSSTSDPTIDTRLNGTDADLAPGVITDLALTTDAEIRTDGTVFSWVDGTFTKGRNFLIAEIQVSEDGGSSWDVVGSTTAAEFRYGPLNPGTEYTFRIIATGANGQANPVVSDPITTSGSPGPADVTNFTAAQDTLDLRKVLFTWSTVNDPDFAYYEIRKGLSWATSPIIGYQIAGTKFEHFEISNGTYTYLVKAVDSSGKYSVNPASRSVVMDIYPPDVTGFVASQNGANILLTWLPSASLDVIGYEIREGADWAIGEVLVDTTPDISVKIPANFERLYTFWIKAKNRRKAYSQNAVSTTLDVTNLLPKNYVIVRDEIASPSGVHYQTAIGGPFWTFDKMPGTFADYPNLAFNDFPGENVLKLATTTDTLPSPLVYDEIASPTGVHNNTEIGATQFAFDKMIGTFADYPDYSFDDFPSGDTLKFTNIGGVYELTGDYTVKYDLGSLLSVQIDVDWAFLAIPAGSAATLEIRTSNDDVIWSGWEVFTSCEKVARYFEFRLGITNTSVEETPEVTALEVTFSATGGSEVYFDSGYYICEYDIGQPTTCDIAVDKFLFVLPPGVSASLDYQYSIDNIAWSPWEVFVPSQKTFRYIRFRMNLATTDNTLTPEITRFSVAIDVPDITQKGTSVTPIEGEIISFTAPYNFAPTLVVSVEGADNYSEYSAVTNEEFFVIVRRVSDGSAIGGRTINWISKGY